MKAVISDTTKHVLLWKMFYIKAVFMSLVTFGTAYQLGTQNIKVNMLDFWEVVSLIIGILVIWGTNMISLLDKTAANIQKGTLFGDGDDVPPTVKQETTQVTVTNETKQTSS